MPQNSHKISSRRIDFGHPSMAYNNIKGGRRKTQVFLKNLPEKDVLGVDQEPYSRGIKKVEPWIMHTSKWMKKEGKLIIYAHKNGGRVCKRELEP